MFLMSRTANMWLPMVAMVTTCFSLTVDAATYRIRPMMQDSSGSGCPPPNVALNGSVLSTARIERHRSQYAEVKEVKFTGEIGPLGEKTICKIKCMEGAWVGPLCQTQDDGGRYHPLFRGCKFDYIPPQLVVSFQNVTITTENITFPHGGKVQVRCKELGVYKLMGQKELQCHNGAWVQRIPACIPTTLLTNFTEDSPPTLLVRIPSGSASVEPSGMLAVFPGSILHLECLFSRKRGNPEWTWTHKFQQYLTGWAIASDEREWKYRLSIYYSKPQDTGTFICATPRGLTNSVEIHVEAVHCEPFEVTDHHLTSRVEGSRLGHVAVFQCPIGFKLNGTANLTCQASGRWSAALPNCLPIICPTLEIDDPHLALVEHNTSYGGRAVFRCSWGYLLTGPPGVECEVDGTWSGPPPACQAIKCPPPLPPINGRLVEEGLNYKVGTAVQYACNDRHQLVGEATVVCTETGFWSHPPPFCKPRCPYPGDPPHGRIAPVKFSYEPGDHLQVTCSAGYVVRLEARPQCRGDGTWSEQLPECRSYRDV